MNFFVKAGIVVIAVVLLVVVLSFIYLVFPFFVYRSYNNYKNDKEGKKRKKEFDKHWEEMSEFFPETPIKKEYLRPALVIQLRKDVPFVPDKRQVIYIESEYNEILNNYISREYDKINEAFTYRGFTFIYIPLTIKKLTEQGSDVLKYFYPSLNDTDILLNEEIIARHIQENILSYSDEPVSINGGLMRYIETNDNYHIFRCFQFTNFEETEIWEQFRTYINVVDDSQIMYSLMPSMPSKEIPIIDFFRESEECYKVEIPFSISESIMQSESEADDCFPYAAQNLIDEIKERIELLKQTGISEMVIKSLFKFDDALKLSRLTITKDYHIFLPDYNHLEINMTPLPKAIFFLFLKHPEGILFKHLPDYKSELMNIYMQISNREKLSDMEKSIDDVTDPTKNAINEKCSRIREAFIRHFDESLAQNYFITGLRSEPKRITLDRQLVTWS